MGAGYSFETAAQRAGVPVAMVEAAAKSGAVKVFTVNGQRVINEIGLSYLSGVGKARAEALGGTGETPATRAATENQADPATWSEDTIKAKAKAIADSLRGANPDPTLPQGIETITFRGRG